MRIGMLADIYKPHISGVTTHISLTKQYLEALGHEVFVFTFGDEQLPQDEPNVIRSHGLPFNFSGYPIGVNYSRPVRKLLHTMNVIHAHHPFFSGSLALRYCRPRGIPIVVTNHTRYDLYTQAYLQGMLEILSSTALQAYLPAFYRVCDLVIAPSEGMRNVLLDLGVDVPVEVVPNGVDLKPYQQPIQPVERRELGFGKQDVVLVYLGRLGPEKNLSFLLRSFAGTTQAYSHTRLLLVGDGPERDNLEDQARHMGIASQVCFTGEVAYDQVPRYLKVADFFATASVSEVHPLSVIEAMASGLPTLGIRSPGIEDTIRDGETGYLAPEADLAAFTAKMVRLVVDKEDRCRMGSQALLAAQDYAIEHTTQKVLECYYMAIDRASGRRRGLRARLNRWLDGL